MASRRLIVVRHGETEWSRSGRHTGRTDIPLTDLGRAQAAALGARLQECTLSAVWTSPLSRAADTCDLAGLGDQAKPLEDLMEWDYGAYEGITTAEIRKTRPGWTIWADGAPDGETPADVGARADRVVEAALAVEGDVAVFAHGHFLRMLAARWLGLAPSEGRLLALDPATFGILGHEREQRVVRLWNDSGHLEDVED
jgi:probable phosphoglycerate mutase